MTPRWLSLICGAGLLTGCAHTTTSTLVEIETERHSPIRMHKYDNFDPTIINGLLLLPPLGMEDETQRSRFHEQLSRAMLRRFSTPVKEIAPDSAYAPYITGGNLLLSDGTLNLKEIAIIGNLMGASYVICPHVRSIRIYHPQCIDLRIVVINARTDTVCAELSAVFDAQDRDVVEYFNEFCKANKKEPEEETDLSFRLKSPSTFQAFAADTSSTVLAEKLMF
ncbi:MAG: hypothetical protein JXR25_04875 [Pontiellaceae bacterium]|nr:hypothetical protein [Pontiellaceae bacterium]MBN2784140.1 hypothetical protein [Pontiellaceae bacterium]